MRVIAFLTAGLLLAGCSKPKQEAATPESVSVKVRAARIDTIRDRLVAVGTVVPAPAAVLEVYAPETSTIAELSLAEGAAVKAGDLLIRFELPATESDMAAKQAAINSATSKLDGAKAELAKQTSLFERQLTPKSLVDAAEQAVKQAESDLTHAQAIAKAAKSLSDRAVVRAPFAGTVTKRTHNEGDLVDERSGSLLTVVDPTRVQVRLNVTAGQALKLTPGMAAVVSDPAAGTSSPATVVFRGSVTDTTVSSVEVRVGLAPSAPGTPAAPPPALDQPQQVEILIDTHEKVLVIPTSAIQRLEAVPFVMLAGSDGKAHRRDVQLGLADAGMTEVLGGIAAGDEVIVTNLDQVGEGTVIDIER